MLLNSLNEHPSMEIYMSILSIDGAFKLQPEHTRARPSNKVISKATDCPSNSKSLPARSRID